MAESVKLLVSVLEAPAPAEYKRVALLELALVAQQEDQLPRALQILAQYVRRYPEDPSVPAVLLRQGLICRQMGAQQMALAKFYAVMTTALNLKLDRFQQYQRLVLQAQVEIAETHDLRGSYAEAAECYARLLTQDTTDLNRAQIQFKLIHCLTKLDRNAEVVAQADDFLSRYPDRIEQPEVRFLVDPLAQTSGARRRCHQAGSSTVGNRASRRRSGTGTLDLLATTRRATRLPISFTCRAIT